MRPFLGVGKLGGFTTFSTYAVEIRGLLAPSTVGVAFIYLAGTLLTVLVGSGPPAPSPVPPAPRHGEGS